MMTVTLANLTPDRDIEVSLEALGFEKGKTAEIMTLGDGNLHAHNTFDEPEKVMVRRGTAENFDGRLTPCQRYGRVGSGSRFCNRHITQQ